MHEPKGDKHVVAADHDIGHARAVMMSPLLESASRTHSILRGADQVGPGIGFTSPGDRVQPRVTLYEERDRGRVCSDACLA